MTTNPSTLPRVTSEIALRRLHPDDLQRFQHYRNDPEVGRYQGWSESSDAGALEFLDAVSRAPLLEPGEWTQIAIAEPVTLDLIGDIGLLLAKDGDACEVGFTLTPAHQGQGLAVAAVRECIGMVFETTGAQRVVGITDARNVPSIRLLERLGMRRISTDETVFQGEPCIEHTYVLDRPADMAGAPLSPAPSSVRR